MNWEDLLVEFRALGGVADNIAIRQGSLGRGVFPVDPKKPVRLHTPPNLLVPSADTELRAGKLVVKEAASLGERERIFFERYQQDFLWGAGTLDELWQAQLQWSELPKNVQEKLSEIGPVDADRFAEPNADLCYRRYLATRQFSYRGTPVLMPVVELLNHRDQAGKFDSSDGIGVECTSSDEVLVSYGPYDCWSMAMTYGFFAARRLAHSLKVNLTFEDLDIHVSRKFGRGEPIDGVPVPTVDVDGNKVSFSFLTLGNIQRPRIPRSAFLHAAKTTPIKQPDALFDLIQHYNCVKLVGFLRVADGLSLPLATMLRRAAYRQLETLSAHFGSRSLKHNS
jgi:hypothetical protein